MKVKIAYLPGEEKEAETIHYFIKSLINSAKVNRSDRHAPYRHIYIVTERQLDTTCQKEKNVV